MLPASVYTALVNTELTGKLTNLVGAGGSVQFDLIAGTSTGGILTCMYVCPSDDHPDRPRLSAAEAVMALVRANIASGSLSWMSVGGGNYSLTLTLTTIVSPGEKSASLRSICSWSI